jgi:hypothetical protein
MWSPANCRLVPGDFSYRDARAAVADLAEAIRAGRTSRAAQRDAYLDHLAPGPVGERWREFLARDAEPRLAPELLDTAVFPSSNGRWV